MSALTITRLSVKEAVSRKLLLAGAVLSLAFLVLFALGFNALYSRAASEAGQFETAQAGGIMTLLGVYIVQFLVAFLALFLATGAVSSEIDSGTLHAVLARPLSRRSWLGQRWLAFAGTIAVYAMLIAGLLLVIARVIAGYGAVSPVRAISLLVLEGLVLLSLGFLGSTLWSTLANGAVVFSLFGMAWLAGIIEFAGEMVGNEFMRNIGIAVSLLVPSDALWRGAAYYLQSPAFLAASSAMGEPGGAGPFGGSAPPSAALVGWSIAYAVLLLALAARRFARRDL
ncbi:MAG: ABC transporter permease subunit [Actinomycetota bacterium]|nr:ABC transporter permease subunit [Actinomycetota bacterium]